MASVLSPRDPAVADQLAVLQELFGCRQPPDFAVRFWDGSTWGPEPARPVNFTLVLRDAGSLRDMFWPPNDLSVGEAYIYDRCDVEGDMVAFLALLRGRGERRRALGERLRLGWRLWRLPAVARPRVGRQAARLTGRPHSLERDRQAISFHYDVSNDFFALWLDPRLVYSGAYFTSPEDGLAQAQEQKLAYLCRKLRLRAGERLLDVGCGWGGLLIFAAQNYGVEATGVTLSAPQAQLARQRIGQLGLEGRCRVECADYRLLDQSRQYDKIASIGFTEHLGESMLPTFCRKAHTLLRPGGALLVQTIALTGHSRMARWRKFNQRYVLPDGELVPVSIHLREAETAGFEVRDVESLREHYTLTLKAWLSNLEGNYEKAVRLTDEATWRTFRLYLAGARYGFTTGVYNLYQALLVKPDRGASGLPLTRADWYR